MPIAKQYASNAERQAAYRMRHPEKRMPTDARLASLARYLHAVLSADVQADTPHLPADLVGGRADETLSNVIFYLDPDPDPVFYSGPYWERVAARLGRKLPGARR